MSAPYTNKPVLKADGTVPAEYYDENYWEHGDASGKGSYNTCEYSDNPGVCAAWAKDCYNRWGPFTDFLELGCGKGWNIYGFLHLEDLHVNARGVDFSHHAIETANPLVKPYLVEHDATDLEFIPDKSFDVVFSNDFLEHLTPDQVTKCLQHCARVSRRSIVHLISIADGDDLPIGCPPATQDQSHVTLRSVYWWMDYIIQVLGHDWLVSLLNHGTTIEIQATRKNVEA